MLISVDIKRILQNINAIKSRLKNGVKFCAVVKADAYGHGIVDVSKAVENEIDFFAVARLGEGIVLRRAGIVKPVIVLNTMPDNEFTAAVKNKLSVTVDDVCQIRTISKICKGLGKTANLHIKIDTGMNRLGVKGAENFRVLCGEIHNDANLNCEGVYSHLASKMSTNPASVRGQTDLFRSYAQISKEYFNSAVLHLANTSAAISFPEAQFDMVRIGIGMYGYSDNNDFKLLPAKSVYAKVIETKTIGKGEGVGYEQAYIADKEIQIAVLDCGYGDGFCRIFAKNGKVLTEFGFSPILGNVCMDLMMVENLQNKLQKGDSVILLGENMKNCLWANDIFENCGTIIYETLCNLRKR